ncbi:hypothetical protein [Roseomonas sp. CAU 1739]|uniref:hypothetical protein n=1 Tax=Roseomonas sp. CAU 1739 TaxID=3140364 RepID=UPI00325AC92A
MSAPSDASEKAQKPATYFEAPSDVATDPHLSVGEKREALDTLEQDARQLAEASNEGMAGGEPNNLHDVLQAKAETDADEDGAPPATWGGELTRTVRERPFWAVGLALLAGVGIGVGLRR